MEQSSSFYSLKSLSNNAWQNSLADTLRKVLFTYYQRWNPYLKSSASLGYNFFRRNEFAGNINDAVYPSGSILEVLTQSSLPFVFSDSLRNYMHIHQDYTGNGISKLGFSVFGRHKLNEKEDSICLVSSLYQKQIKDSDPRYKNHLYKETVLNGLAGVRFHSNNAGGRLVNNLSYIYEIDLIKSPTTPIDRDVKNDNHNFQFKPILKISRFNYAIDFQYRYNFRDIAFREQENINNFQFLQANILDEDLREIFLCHTISFDLLKGFRLDFSHMNSKMAFNYPFSYNNFANKKNRDAINSADTLLFKIPVCDSLRFCISKNYSNLNYIDSIHSYLNDSTNRYSMGQSLFKELPERFKIRQDFTLNAYYKDYIYLEYTDTLSSYAERSADFSCSTTIFFPTLFEIPFNLKYIFLERGYSFLDSNNVRKYGITQYLGKPAFELGISRKTFFEILASPKLKWQSVRYWKYSPIPYNFELSLFDKIWKKIFGVSNDYYNKVNFSSFDMVFNLTSHTNFVSIEIDLTRRREKYLLQSAGAENSKTYWLGFVNINIVF
ncbi:MAG: hypothetical protein AB1633_12225 [Elusimicrobiota bacterium]